MKIVYNSIIPFKRFRCLNLFGILFVRKNSDGSILKLSRKSINHEMIHTEQMKELLYVFFYLWYFIEWLIELVLPPYNKDYSDISFEEEAYMHEDNLDYIKQRKRYNWIKYVFNK